MCGAQSDREKAEGLPVAPFMDREKVTKPTAQIGFIKFVLIPMFETVMKVSERDERMEEEFSVHVRLILHLVLCQTCGNK